MNTIDKDTPGLEDYSASSEPLPLSTEADASINEILERIDNLSDHQQSFLTGFYTELLKQNPENSEMILSILEKDVAAFAEQGSEVVFNSEREVAFAEVDQIIEKLLEEDKTGAALEKWLAGAFNNIFKLHARRLQPSDFSSVSVGRTLSATAAALTGSEAQRPVLIFEDAEQFDYVANLISGQGSSSHGLFYPLGPSSRDYSSYYEEFQPMDKSGIIMTNGLREETLKHEIIHTTDPYVVSREGFDNILTEAMPFLLQTHMDMQRLIDLLDHPVYSQTNLAYETERDHQAQEKGYSPSSRFGQSEKTPELHRQIVEAVVEVLFADIEKMGVVQALRRLAKTRTIEDYLPFKLKQQYMQRGN